MIAIRYSARMVRVALMVTILFGCTAGEDENAAASSKSCAKLRDHVVDLRLAQATNIDREAHRAIMTKGLGEEFIERCTSTLRVAQVRCALEARDTTAVSACRSESASQ